MLLGALGVLVLVVVLAGVALLSPLFNLREIDIEGAAQLDTEEVESASGLSQGENLLFTDTDAAARAVSGLPWVEKVTVSRSWPSTAVVRITEYEAVGVVEDGGESAVINGDGRVFLRGAAPEGTTPVKASSDDQDAVEAAGSVLGSLPEGLLEQVEEVDAPSAEDVTLRFPEGREVYWGSAERAEEKAEATRVVLGREGSVWNVSNPAVPTVRDEAG
ncbi:MAG: cell division protein FtsQ/DivIB [Mycobacteriaceae bacterium]|uniref:cell division protein FtsQ/DivIB n=1 Tax=Corynebacterium sp. TaxID=1720 RepID=UPI003F97FA8C